MFANTQSNLSLLLGQQFLNNLNSNNQPIPSQITPPVSETSKGNSIDMFSLNPFLMNTNLNMTPDVNLLYQMLQLQMLANPQNLLKGDVSQGTLTIDEKGKSISPLPLTPLPSIGKGKKRPSNENNIGPKEKKSRQIRKIIAADTETNSPVSGMYIKDASELSAEDLQKAADIDETAAYVEISEESRREIAKIHENDTIGDSVCALCKVKFEDVFKLAMHKCPRIMHEEYRCECNKVFSCPANLASHRRWHKPKSTDSSPSPQISVQTCEECNETFDSKRALKKHTCSRSRSLSNTSVSSILNNTNSSSSNPNQTLNFDILNSNVSDGINLLASCLGLA
uniref:C2H2-type domain-containing protein n=1 Tax=Parastrongyloides trichosuri TaxID=131310 RepID=A0A0N4ZY97_PARTI